MDHTLRPDEAVSDGIRRVALGQLDVALTALRTADSRHKAVHQARKSCKFIRALLKLTRDELGRPAYEAENAYFRSAQGHLSEMRDAVILVAALDDLAAHGTADGVTPQRIAGARAVLVERCRRRERQDLSDEGPYGLALHELAAAPRRIADWPLRRQGFGLLRPGLCRLYGRARQRHRPLDLQAHGEQFHDWRKQLKALMHSLDVLRPVWPAVMKATHDELHEASDLVGQDHDLEMLRIELSKDAEEFGPPELQAALSVAIDARRRALRSRVLPLGDRLLHEKPDRFVGRLEGYWHAWQRLEPEGRAAA